MRAIELLRDIFRGRRHTEGEEDPDVIYLNQRYETERYRLAMQMFAVKMAINMIAGTVAKCEFKTVVDGKEIKGDEYYRWNVEPNLNQNSNEFILEIVRKSLLPDGCLVIQVADQYIIADSFIQTPYALFPNTFTNVSRGDFTFNQTFSMSDVFYFKMNNADIYSLLHGLLRGYNDILEMSVNKYKRSGGRKITMKLDDVYMTDKTRKDIAQKMFNEDFGKYFDAENAVLPIYKGMEPNEVAAAGSQKSSNEITDIVSITKECISAAAHALGIPPALLLGEVSDVDSVTNLYLTTGVDPFTDMMQAEINRKKYGKKDYAKGCYINIDSTRAKHIDIFDVADKTDKYISDGTLCIDDIRILLGQTPLNTWWSQKHWMTKNYEALEAIEAAQHPPEKEVNRMVNDILKSANIVKSQVEDDDLKLINQNTMKELTPEDVFVFKIAACGNEIDRDFEVFPEKSLTKLADLINGKTIIVDHMPKASNQIARIYKTEIATGAGTTKNGETYSQLIAHCYMLKTESNCDFIADIEAGIKKEVSIRCRVGSVVCSVCGADNMKTWCDHNNGQEYDGAICYKKLENPVDAYEISFVAVPAQPDAGVVKYYGAERPGLAQHPEGDKHKTIGDMLKAAFAGNDKPTE